MAGTQAMIKDVVIDSVDQERLARFWAELLGRSIAAKMGPYVVLGRGDGPGVVFQKVPEPKAGKNRVHFDVASPDPAAEQARAEALGARRIEDHAAGGFLVMAEPQAR